MEFRLSRFIVSVPEMFTFFLIGLLLVLTGLAGLQFTYLFYFDRIDRERKKHIRSLESRAEKLAWHRFEAEDCWARRLPQGLVLDFHLSRGNALSPFLAEGVGGGGA